MSTPIAPDLHPVLARFAIATWVWVLDPTVTEQLAGSGFDFLIVDGEHGTAGAAELVPLLIAARAGGTPVLYRVGANEPIRIMHALDAGAAGVLVPQARTLADVERAVAWCRYPPAGLRGIAGGRAGDYGRDAGYLARANELVTCCVQVETREALEILDDFLAVPGLDAIFVGPNDLAASLGHTGDLEHPEVEAAIIRIAERAAAVGMPAGIWTPSPEVAARRLAQGYSFVTVGSDRGFISKGAAAALAETRALAGS